MGVTEGITEGDKMETIEVEIVVGIKLGMFEGIGECTGTKEGAKMENFGLGITVGTREVGIGIIVGIFEADAPTVFD